MKREQLSAVYSSLAEMYETALDEGDNNLLIVLNKIDELLHSIDEERQQFGDSL